MKKALIFCALLPYFFGSLQAQMWNGTDTLYGNEWIDFSKTYFKFQIGEDGIYRLDFQLLESSGFPVSTVPANEFRLFRNGQQVPIFTSSDGVFSGSDFIEFFGEKQRGELDRHLFQDPENQQLNPRTGLFSDSSFYFLTWDKNLPAARIQTLQNDLSNLPAPEPFCWALAEKLGINTYTKRNTYVNKLQYTFFDGDGWSNSGNTVFPVDVPNVFTPGPNAEIYLRYAGDLGPHDHRWHFTDGSWDSVFFHNQFSDWRMFSHTFSVPPSRLTASAKLTLELPAGDRANLGGLQIKYPRNWDVSGGTNLEFYTAPAGGRRYFEIQNFNNVNNPGNPILYNLTTHTRMLTALENSVAKAVVPAASTEQRFFIFNPAFNVKTVSKVTPTNFKNFKNSNANYLIISHKNLRTGTTDPVAEYAAYRSSPAGGGFNVEVFDISEVYDQFGYGARWSPLAVKNLAFWAAKNWSKPEYLLLLGKGLRMDITRSVAGVQANDGKQALLPVFGWFPADLPFVMDKKIEKPVFSIGRVAAQTPQQVADYLEKVKEHETWPSAPQTIADRAWMKELIHINASRPEEYPALKSSLAGMENLIENSRFGGSVSTFEKNSADPIQDNAYEKILGRVRAGVSIINAFGHSANQGVAFDIGLAAQYKNKGKYPLMIVMGCNAGQCSNPLKSVGEDFVLEKDGGAIAYFSGVRGGEIFAWNQFGHEFYKLLGTTEYGNSIGKIMDRTIEKLAGTQNPYLVQLLQQAQFQGDPAVKIHAAPGPDYVIDNESVQVSPNPVGIETDKFSLQFDVVNIGENVAKPFAINILQKFPNDTLRQLRLDTLPAPAFRQTLKFDLPTPGREALGFNRLLVTADALDQIAEQPAAAEFNNDLETAFGEKGVEVYFFADDVAPVWPPNFGIVREPEATLKVSTQNTNAAAQRYLFEMDTTPRFDSPLKRSTQIFKRGGLLDWKVPGQLLPGQVYHWRVARDSLVGGAVAWRSSSFIFLEKNSTTPTGTGWNQSDFWQFKQDDFQFLDIDSVGRNWHFTENIAHVFVTVGYHNTGQFVGIRNSFDEGNYDPLSWMGNGLILMLFDPLTGRAILNPPNAPSNPQGSDPSFFYRFNTSDSLQRVALMQFIENQIIDGTFVAVNSLARTPIDANSYAPDRWAADSISFGKNLFQVFEKQGARQIRQLEKLGAAPYGLIFRKNMPAFQASDTIIVNADTLLQLRAGIPLKIVSGTLETPVIGPAKSWKSMHWSRSAYDAAGEKTAVQIFGLRQNQPDSLLLEIAEVFDSSLAAVSATDFPFLKLKLTATDTALRTMPQIGYLRIFYESLPEGALDPATRADFYADTLQQGELLRTSFAFQNISTTAFDSVLVKFRIENPNNVGQDFFKKYAPLAPGDTLLTDFEISTEKFSGPQRLQLAVNPDRAQPELHLYNNITFREFFVSRDQRQPLLDVTFDGQHILNGDLVSPKPEIVVSLKDENRYLALSDTATFEIKLVLPDGTTEAIAWNDSRVLFIPASAADLPKKNTARLEFRPTFTTDGEYVLKVNGRDQTGNESSTIDLTVRFRVITKSSLSNLLPYPNPFSTSTCFVYTMTGLETPSQFRLQIMTVAGRVVREVTQAEFGPLRAGTHQSNFCWDGRDQFGDQLANGVYLYRVVAKKADGSDFEFFDNQQVDGFFKNGIGKMVLIR